MALRKSFTELSADLLAAFPDNVVGAITPAILRSYFNEFLQAIRPAYGVMSRNAPNTQNLGVADIPVVFETFTPSDVPDYTGNAATGTITRVDPGTTRITFTASVEVAASVIVTISLYKNGVITPWSISANGAGAGKVVDVSMVTLTYNAAAANYQFQARASAAASPTTFSNMDAIAETVPVNAY